MNQEAREFNSTEKSRLIRTLPKPLDTYSARIQLFIQTAEKQRVKLSIKQALITYAVWALGQDIPKKNGPRSPLLTTEEISQILGIPEKDIKTHIRLIEEPGGISAWVKFEKDIRQSSKKPPRSNK